MKEILLEFNIDPVPKGRPRMGRHTVYTPASTVMFERNISILSRKQYTDDPLEGPLEVVVNCELRRAKSNKSVWPISARSGDVDNYAKSVLDGLNGVIWHDDAQICSLLVRKCYTLDRGPGRISVRVNELISFGEGYQK